MMTITSLIVAFTLHHLALAGLWYYAPIRILIALSAGYSWNALSAIVSSRSRRIPLFLGTATLLLVVGTVRARAVLAPEEYPHLYSIRLATARWLSQRAPSLHGAVGSWNAGQLAFFGWPARVVNLDGLMQSPSFLSDVLKPGRLLDFLRDNNVRYLADYNEHDSLQTFGEPWDSAVYFRKIIPFDSAVVLGQFGPEEFWYRMYVLDIAPLFYQRYQR